MVEVLPQERVETSDAEPRRTRRRLWWVLGGLGAVLALGAGGGYLALKATSDVANTGVAECSEVPVTTALGAEVVAEARAGACAAVAELGRAWAEHDADAYGAVFTENATYTTFAATHYVGREDIVRSHEALFDGVLAGTRLTDSYLGLQVLTEDVAVLTARGDTYEGDEPGEPSKVQTYTLLRDGDTWRVAAFQNTQRQEVMERIQYLWMPETRPAAER
ncbi:SgcJ/EcaC family oxidoreductase [Actinoalloteichus spitiensis]|uniref:SgcJ/EcaC family oxidoreductase n=1 Tax=Actinoalloteichus spitiensis TaxID=252394 RepID=UPI001FDFE7D3|nr:SgcJ/EcaC family oxidoreductase [Actinoalloteichus spitiensis]